MPSPGRSLLSAARLMAHASGRAAPTVVSTFARTVACSVGFSRSLQHTVILLWLSILATAAPTLSFHIVGDAPGSWPAILSSIGLRQNPVADVLVIPSGAQLSLQEAQSHL